jgi:hypothetical protein
LFQPVVGGGSRWEIINVPRRVSFSQWQGQDLYALDIPILFDGFMGRDSVEGDIQALVKMTKGETFDPPPRVTIRGGLPIDVVDVSKWVITSISWGTEAYWSRVPRGNYYRTRQDATVHVLEYHAAPRVKIRAPSTRSFLHVPKDAR